jgi:hypothetical protein
VPPKNWSILVKQWVKCWSILVKYWSLKRCTPAQ